MMLLFFTVSQHESGTRKRYLGQKPNTNVQQKISGQYNVTTRIEQMRDKKKTLTGQRRNTIKTSYVSILRLPSFYLYMHQTI